MILFLAFFPAFEAARPIFSFVFGFRLTRSTTVTECSWPANETQLGNIWLIWRVVLGVWVCMWFHLCMNLKFGIARLYIMATTILWLTAALHNCNFRHLRLWTMFETIDVEDFYAQAVDAKINIVFDCMAVVDPCEYQNVLIDKCRATQTSYALCLSVRTGHFRYRKPTKCWYRSYLILIIQWVNVYTTYEIECH